MYGSAEEDPPKSTLLGGEPMARRGNFRTQAPREITVVLAALLWIVGFADVILGAVALSGSSGEWALGLSGLLLLIGSVTTSI